MSYAGAQYPNAISIFNGSRATSYLTGGTALAPVGSNLLAPGVLGRYGATSWSNNSAPGKVTAKQFMLRCGPMPRIVGTVTLAPPGGATVGMPAYGN